MHRCVWEKLVLHTSCTKLKRVCHMQLHRRRRRPPDQPTLPNHIHKRLTVRRIRDPEPNWNKWNRTEQNWTEQDTPKKVHNPNTSSATATAVTADVIFHWNTTWIVQLSWTIFGVSDNNNSETHAYLHTQKKWKFPDSAAICGWK